MPNASTGLANRYPKALVTGASSGIGKAIAQSLLNEGVVVYGTSRQPENPELNPAVQWLRLDGNSREGIEAFISDRQELLSKVNILVNNAGSSLFGSTSKIPNEASSGQHSLLFEAPLRLTRFVLEHKVEGQAMAIINISSMAAIFPLPYMADYSASKAGLSAFTQDLILTEKVKELLLIDFQAGDYRTDFNKNIRRYGEMDAAQKRAWARLEENLAAGPEPEQAGRDLIRALQRGRSGLVRSGGFFQCRLAPFGIRFLPRKMVLWAIRKYYRLP